ncbi:hypothetical protein [Gimesia panareensis]|uniref:hypothetical protein n=1 Tax=Gimesia panareensis TaxID=2527978 RepID=UPI00119F5D81|nr:hypothetical protein [Gimesia panareensis]
MVSREFSLLRNLKLVEIARTVVDARGGFNPDHQTTYNHNHPFVTNCPFAIFFLFCLTFFRLLSILNQSSLMAGGLAFDPSLEAMTPERNQSGS